MEITPDTTAADVTADVVETLSEVTVGGKPLFIDAITADDVESFARVGDPLKGMVACVISRPARRGRPGSSGEQYVERLDLQVAFRFMMTRAAGDDEKTATEEMHRVANVIKAALADDPTRGGKCHAVRFGGTAINRQDLSGEPRLVAPKPNQSFYIAVLPVSCTWAR